MRYDAQGRRVALTDSNGTDLGFIYAGDMVIADINIEGQEYNGTLRRYVPGASVDDRIAMMTVNPATGATTAREYYHADRLGSVISMVAGGTGAQTAQYVYTPYGVESPYNASGNPYRYTGRRLDAQWGVYYYRARYYDPQIGRFLETDPAWFVDSTNLYAYVGNNPLNATDPTGMIKGRGDCSTEGATPCLAGYPDSGIGSRTERGTGAKAEFVAPYPTIETYQPAPSTTTTPGGGMFRLGRASVLFSLLALGGDTPVSLGNSSSMSLIETGVNVEEAGREIWFHYTDYNSAVDIARTQRISGRSSVGPVNWSNRSAPVYISQRVGSPNDISNALLLGRPDAAAEFVVMFSAPPSFRTVLRPDPRTVLAGGYIHPGSIRNGRNGVQFHYVGQNPF